MLAEVEQLGGGGELAARVVREHDLAAVPDAPDPCREMDVDPDVALAGRDGRSRVDADPHAHGPRLEPLASLARRRERLVRRAEDVEERVALRVDLRAAVPLERLPQDAPVLAEHGRVAVAELVQELGRALDVGEEEGQPAVGQLAHGTIRP